MFLQFVVEVDRSENVSMNENYPSEPNIAIEHRNAKKNGSLFLKKKSYLSAGSLDIAETSLLPKCQKLKIEMVLINRVFLIVKFYTK